MELRLGNFHVRDVGFGVFSGIVDHLEAVGEKTVGGYGDRDGDL